MSKTYLLLSALLVLFLYSCHTETTKDAIIASQETIIDTAIGSCPYLTKDASGNVVLSWIKQVDTVTRTFCYAVSQDEGKSFGTPIEIPGSSNIKPHGENLPKVVFKPSGEILAVWGTGNPNPNNKYSGLVYFAQSFDEGKTWSKPSSLVKDTASFDQRYFDVAILPGGEAGIVWLDNRKTSNKEGSGLYYAVTNGKGGFQNEKLISEPCCQCCRTDLFIDSKKNMHVLYRGIINDSIRDMVHITSTDGGTTFTKPARISNDNWVINGCPHTGPAMTENKEGIHFAWFTAGGGAGIYYNHSSDHGTSFSPRDAVSGGAAKHSQITTLPDGNILIVWNEAFTHGGNVSNRIGIEERSEEGNHILKQYITSETSQASYPVIQSINENTVIVAYTQSTGEKDHVYYKVVTIK
jgi:hypothetical protein